MTSVRLMELPCHLLHLLAARVFTAFLVLESNSVALASAALFNNVNLCMATDVSSCIGSCFVLPGVM